MNQHINPSKTGLTVGTLLGGIHIVWSILIWLGWAQGLVNFSLWAHMVSMPVVIKAFDPSAAVAVIIVAAVVGYIVGYAFARIVNWDQIHRV